ncbi:hypothetical protein HMPREF9136_0302 [Prevotella dentalis DSM 3688]|uniref:Uncharacterized protein n=1 Tax=Prevotella dentalis (strain ATCC 49559 / DSM 3688 / JCM 13448 / NCTC 12043 / ES 2772) TaxID=908937 RepID=F9D0C4_PREDD|nr:hypothetical protein HMPREF9136_0302 [Prevotella dentalis DSM 3688]
MGAKRMQPFLLYRHLAPVLWMDVGTIRAFMCSVSFPALAELSTMATAKKPEWPAHGLQSFS